MDISKIGGFSPSTLGQLNSSNSPNTAPPASAASSTSEAAFQQLLQQMVEMLLAEQSMNMTTSFAQSLSDSSSSSASDGLTPSTGASSSLMGLSSGYPSLLSALPFFTQNPLGTSPLSANNPLTNETPVTGWSDSGNAVMAPNDLAPLVNAAAEKYNLPSSLLSAVIDQESGFQPNAVSNAGAMGLMQLMPSTAASLGVTDPLDPASNIDGGAQYLRQLLNRFSGNVPLALAAYNAGPNAVASYGGIPPYPETQAYVKNIMARSQM